MHDRRRDLERQMRDIAYWSRLSILGILLCIASLLAAPLHAAELPAIYLTPQHPVYSYLERLNAKGLLPHAGLGTKPWTRTQIASALLEVSPSDPHLTESDVRRWWFYIGEFADEIVALEPDHTALTHGELEAHAAWWTAVSERDRSRWREALSVQEGDGVSGRFEVGIGASAEYDTSLSLGRQTRAGGWLRLGQHWSAQALMVDDAVVGSNVVPPARYSPEPGTAYIDGDTASAFTYDDPQAYVTYHNRFVTASAGVFPVVLGHGEHGQVVLSEKAPALPHVRITAHPWPWLSFTYLHMTLQSGVPDTVGPWWEQTRGESDYLSKYYAAHRLEFTGIEGVDLGFGESVIYGARSPALIYMIPVVPLRAAQHAEGDLDNLQMYADVAVSRIPWTRLYGTFFIDELSIGDILDGSNAHNWWIWQVGAYVTDMWGLVLDLDLRAEYVHANPWVYSHQYAWNTYDTWAVDTSDPIVAYPLGFWNGHNGDFFRADVTWRARWNTDVSVWWSQTRRGDEGTPEEQYSYEAEPFLFGDVTRERILGVRADWEPWRDVSVFGEVQFHRWRFTADTAARSRDWTAFALGVRYRVW